MNKYRWILLVAMLGFLGTGLETRYLHQIAVTERLTAWIPTVVSALGAMACLLALSLGWKSRSIAVLILLVALAAGPLGVYFHTDFRTSELLRIFHNEPENRLMRTAKGDIAPPAEAPITLSGLALISLLAAAGHWAVLKQNGVVRNIRPTDYDEPHAT